jgi:hypothetical protein
MSRYDDRVLMPGVEGAFSLGIRGAGGGGGNGEAIFGDGGGVGGKVAVGIGIVAFVFKCWILSLYTSFNSLISFNPSLIRKSVSISAIFGVAYQGEYSFAFLASFSLYFSKTLSDC